MLVFDAAPIRAPTKTAQPNKAIGKLATIRNCATRKLLFEHTQGWGKAVDHELSWSLYFNDPDGNPHEITSYAFAELAAQLRV